MPLGWQWVPFSDVAVFENGDRSKKYPKRAEYVTSGVPWINTGLKFQGPGGGRHSAAWAAGFLVGFARDAANPSKTPPTCPRRPPKTAKLQTQDTLSRMGHFRVALCTTSRKRNLPLLVVAKFDLTIWSTASEVQRSGKQHSLNPIRGELSHPL